MTEKSPFSIQFFLASGQVHTYVESDPAAIKKNLSFIRPEKLFSGESILIGGERCASAIRPSDLLRIEVHAEPRPHWAFGPRVESIRLVSVEEAQELQAKLASPDHVEPKTGEHFEALIAMDDAHGETFWVKVSGELGPAALLRNAVTRILNAPFLHAETGDSDIFFNIAQMHSLHVYPCPKTLATTAWSAQRVS